MDQQHVESFPPLVFAEPKVLILGSMPSLQSLQRQEYYGHPRNHFWPLLYALAGRPAQTDYAQKRQLLRDCGVALWDVLASCQRTGSSDASIRQRVVNPIGQFIQGYPTLHVVCFNGREAQRTFDNHLQRSAFPRLTFIELPSSSPIPTKKARSFAEKLRYWQVLKPYLHCPHNA